MTGVVRSTHLYTKYRTICHRSSLQQLQRHTHVSTVCVCVCVSLQGPESVAVCWDSSSFLHIHRAQGGKQPDGGVLVQTAPNTTLLLRGNLHLSSAAFYKAVIWGKVSSLCYFIYFESFPNVPPGTAVGATGSGPVQPREAGEGGRKQVAGSSHQSPQSSISSSQSCLSEWNQY